MLDTVEAHSSGTGGAVYVGQNPLRIISCGEDGQLTVRDTEDPSTQLSAVEMAEPYPMLAMAAHPEGSSFATCEKNKSIKLYAFPVGIGYVATRLELPGRALSYSGTGNILAAASDGEIKLINITPDKESNTVKGNVFRRIPSVALTRSLAYDPESEYLASLSATGHLQIWTIANGALVKGFKGKGPDVSGDNKARVGLAWHPDSGTLLAAAGIDNDVVFYERLSWSVAFTLQGVHQQPVSLISFSPNGLYVATAGRDKQVVVWDLHLRKSLAVQEGPAVLTSLMWRPDGNCLLCMGEDGRIALWRDAVPSGHPGPCDDAGTAAAVPQETGSFQEHSEAHDDGSLGAVSMEGDGEGERDAFDDIINGTYSSAEKEAAPASERPGRARYGSAPSGRARLQGPIQPGSSLAAGDVRCWLAYSLLGAISLRQEDDLSILEVSFHDTLSHRKRIAPYRDYQGFTLASLAEKGALFGKVGGTREEAVLMWRPFDAWAPNSDWTLTLPIGEQLEAVAAGKAFIAAATSTRTLRIFSFSGLQIWICTLAGPPVALAAHKSQLAVVWHGVGPVASDQALQFAVYDMSEQALLFSGNLPLSSGSTLTWLGFSEEEQLAAFDSEGVIRVRATELGGSWVPVFSSAEERKGEETHWPVALSRGELFCIMCASGQAPAVLPRPVLSQLPLKPPVVAGEGPIAGLEADLLRLSMHLSLLRSRPTDQLDIFAAEQLEEDTLAQETDVDRTLLKLFQAALKGERLQRALELASRLHLRRSLEGALQLTNHHRVPALADRISRLLEAQQAQEAEGLEPESAITPLPPPTFTPAAGEPLSAERPSPPPRLAQVAITEASGNADDDMKLAIGSETKPVSRATATGSNVLQGANPFARKTGGPLRPKTNTLFANGADDQTPKRKAPASNPFARRPKVTKL